MPSRQSFRILADENVSTLGSNSSSHKSLVVPLAVGGAGLFAIFLLFLFLWYRKRLKLASSRTSPDDGAAFKLQKFTYRELRRATNGFSETRKLGKGGFGIVYRGVLRNGKEVAVKKLELSSLQGEREFQNEMSINGGLNSPHVVSLLGYCTHGKKVRLLVYDCMQNRSLQEALFDKSYPVLLNWEKRFKIIQDTAKALSFLHLECNPPVIHGDVKPSNILLDGNFSARIADFGLARFKTEEFWVASGRHFISVDNTRSGTPDKSRHGTPERFTPNPLERLPHKTCEGDAEGTPRKLNTECTGKGKLQGLSEEEKRVQESCDEKQFINKEAALSADVNSSCCSPNTPQCIQSARVGVSEKWDLCRPSPGDGIDNPEAGLSPRSAGVTMTEEGDDTGRTYPSEGNTTDEIIIVDRSKEQQKLMPKKHSGKDWWWKQESGELSVKDYVMEWIGNELQTSNQRRGVRNEQHKEVGFEEGNNFQGKRREREGQTNRRTLLSELEKKEKRKGKMISRKSREWWKDEYFAELNKKGKGGRKKKSFGDTGKENFSGDLSGYSGELKRFNKREREQKKGSCRSKDWRVYHSGDLSFGRNWWNHRKQEETNERTYWSGDLMNAKSGGNVSNRQWSGDLLHRQWSGDLLRSGELVNKSGELVSRDVSSTTSMRGTVCYVAPEYGGAGVLSDKGDIYSFGVLILVILSGRRPIQVTASPMKEFERANLISWARSLSQSGNALDLVDERLEGNYNRDQATLCITLALLCLQRLPATRPNIADVVKILTGEASPPSFPLEFSPSPPSKWSIKSPIEPASECITNEATA